tara:strand:- start:89 stop:394 length:306 start_codon:yes stop_codon:yes gene_type:complete
MFKNFFLFFCLLLIVNCSTPSSAFLGPIFTGARTGSIYQASLSYGSNKIFTEVKEFHHKKSLFRPSQPVAESSFYNEPIIQVTSIIDKVEISEIIDPEPLP